MEEALKLVEKAADVILKSQCYKDYCYYKDKIEKNNELRKKLNDFRKLHIDFQWNKANGNNISFEEEKYISQTYFSLMTNKDIMGFFKNERILLSLINKFYDIINNKIKIEVNF